MADSSSSQDRTESATPRRRQKAREEGRIAKSQEVLGAAILLGGILTLAAAGLRPIGSYVMRLFRESAAAFSAEPLTTGIAGALVRSAILGFLGAMAPFLAGVVVLVVLVHFVQTKGVVSWKLLMPNWSMVDPVNGLKRLFNPEVLFTLLKSIVKLAALSLVAFAVISKSWPEWVSLVDSDPAGILTVIRAVVFKLAIMTGLAFAAVAAVDFAFQWFRTEKSLRMTRQEVVQEFRESEGNPHVKARILQLGRARSRRRMLQSVPAADVVIVNPTRIAVALKYDVSVAAAPVVVAMGQRKIAQRIREIANAAGVPIIENRAVAKALLVTAKIGKPIPPALYTAVAEILAFVYRQRAKARRLENMLPQRRTA